MFVTHDDWAADDTAQKIAAPFMPWKCLTMTSAEPKFLIEVHVGTTGGPSVWFASGLNPLLEFTNHWGPRVFRVSLLFEGDKVNRTRLISLTEIREIRRDGSFPLFAYQREDGLWHPLDSRFPDAIEIATAASGELLFTLVSTNT
jgi:hypothetical protein